MRFQATIRLDGKTTTGFEVPAEVLEAFGQGKRPNVRVTINGYTYPSAVGTMRGLALIPVSADVRGKAGVAAGDTVDVDVVVDTEVRTVAVPDDLRQALDRAPAARQAFDQLSSSRRKAHVVSVEGAKTDETRQRRIAKVVAELA